jgi:putative ABC transport system ATP-binding protein
MIEVSDISKQVNTAEGTLNILDKINLSLASGESLAIIGPSGSGKSTLLGILAGLDLPSSGSVRLNGRDITAMNEEGRAAVRAKHVGFVFQSFHLLPGLTALENVALPLERVGLDHRMTHYPRQLSGGEQQRVAVARAFACRPTILFADEPTGNLDTGTGEKINDLLFELNKEEGTTLVLVTHELNLATRCGQRLVLAAGQQVVKTIFEMQKLVEPVAIKTEAKTKPAVEAKPTAKPKAKSVAKLAAEQKPTAKPKLKSRAKPAAQNKSAVKAKVSPASKRVTEPKSTAKPKSAASKPKAKPKIKSKPTAKAKVKPKAISKAKPKSQGNKI